MACEPLDADVDDDDEIPPPPDDLGPEGTALWESVHAEYADLGPHHMAILANACRQATLIARLERAVKRSGTRTKGYNGKGDVIAPEIPELRQQKQSFIAAMKALQLPMDEPEDGRKMTRSESGAYAASVRWNKSGGAWSRNG